MGPTSNVKRSCVEVSHTVEVFLVSLSVLLYRWCGSTTSVDSKLSSAYPALSQCRQR